VVFCIDFLNIKDYPINIEDDFSSSLFDLLENKYNLTINYALTEIIPVAADEFLEEKLNIKKHLPLLLLKQLHYDDNDQIFLYSKNYFRSDQFQFKVVRKR
jgi:GntR family transcriptional regulator